jgi:hypothetical protein
VGSRERKRAERKKRKRRGAESQPEDLSPQSSEESSVLSPQSSEESRSEQRNRETREGLEPLHQGERPRVVTVGAVIAGLIALSTLVAYVAGAKVNGERPLFLQFLAPTLLMGMMSYGMWRARYWAVLGFQVVLAFLILGAAGQLLLAANAAQVIYGSFILVSCGALFYFMVKAMARIQMPQRLPPK